MESLRSLWHLSKYSLRFSSTIPSGLGSTMSPKCHKRSALAPLWLLPTRSTLTIFCTEWSTLLHSSPAESGLGTRADGGRREEESMGRFLNRTMCTLSPLVGRQVLEGLMAGTITKDTREKVSSTSHHKDTSEQEARVRLIDHHRSTTVFQTEKRRVCTNRMPGRIREIHRWMQRV